MSLLVFGESGQVGIYLQRQMGPDAPYLILGRDRADLTDPEACADIIRKSRPAVVINAAAIHDELLAERNEELAHLVNAIAPGHLARTCAEMGVPLVHLSTAEVFDGNGEAAWRPSDQPNPVNALGRSKLAGEDAIRAAGGAHVILRSSWVISAQGDNLMTRLLKQAKTNTRIEVAADQVSAPTSAHELAMASQIAAMRIIEDRSLSGTYHYQSKPQARLSDVARFILSEAGLTCEVVDTITSGGIAKPLNTRLDCLKTENNLGLRSPDWQRAVQIILNDLGYSVSGR